MSLSGVAWLLAGLLAVHFAHTIGWIGGVLLPREPASRRRACPPRRIHQVYLGETGPLPPAWAEVSQQWRRVHKAAGVRFNASSHMPQLQLARQVEKQGGWTYWYWDARAVRALQQARYPDVLEASERDTWTWVQRADLARFTILNTYGGLYSDLDVVPTQPMDRLWDGCPGVVLPRCDTPLFEGLTLSGDLLLFAPGHPFLLHLLRAATSRIRSRWVRLLATLSPYAGVMFSTGPFFVTHQLLQFTHRVGWAAGELVLIGDGLYTGSGDQLLVRHLPGSSWHSWDAHLFKFLLSGPLQWAAVLLAVLALATWWGRRRELPNAPQQPGPSRPTTNAHAKTH